MRQTAYIILAICGLVLGAFGLAKGLAAMEILHVFSKSEQNFVIAFSIVGTVGGIISWIMSTSIGQWSLNARPYAADDRKAPFGDLEAIVSHLADKLGLKTPPALWVYNSKDVNAFAAGPLPRFSKLIVSSGLLASTDKAHVEAIVAQVLAKLASGDVSTLLLMHGIINVFTVFPTRMFALLLGTTLRTAEEETPSDSIENWMKIAFEIVFTPFTGLVTRQFARSAEKRADAKAAQLVGNGSLATTLRSLAPVQPAAGTREMFTAPLMFGARVKNVLQPLSYHSPMQSRAESVAKATA